MQVHDGAQPQHSSVLKRSVESVNFMKQFAIFFFGSASRRFLELLEFFHQELEYFTSLNSPKFPLQQVDRVGAKNSAHPIFIFSLIKINMQCNPIIMLIKVECKHH